VRQTPLAAPVVPEVKTIRATSPSRTGTGWNAEAEWRAMSCSVATTVRSTLEQPPMNATCALAGSGKHARLVGGRPVNRPYTLNLKLRTGEILNPKLITGAQGKTGEPACPFAPNGVNF
jgi:hypothetical protein